MIKKKIGIIGCGNMGGAILAAILKRRCFSAQNIIISDRLKEKSAFFKKRFKVKIAGSNSELIKRADIVIIAVKPQDAAGLLTQIWNYFNPKKLLISVAAGIKIDKISDIVGKNVPVIRAMPNMPALAGEAMTFISSGSCASKSNKKDANDIFSCLGEIEEIDEKFLDAVTALSGSGPAYFFYLMEILAKMGQRFGIARDISKKLAVQTALGSAQLAKLSKIDFENLRRIVVSKGGTTEAAFKVFAKYRLDKIVNKAILAAYKRSKQLSR